MSTPAEVPEVPEVPQKPQKQRKPPSPHIPRLFAALAIITLLAVPVVVPVVVMKMTGKSGRKQTSLADLLVEPESIASIIVTAPEETTKEEVKESFLKLNDSKVCKIPSHAACIVTGPAFSAPIVQPTPCIIQQQPSGSPAHSLCMMHI